VSKKHNDAFENESHFCNLESAAAQTA